MTPCEVASQLADLSLDGLAARNLDDFRKVLLGFTDRCIHVRA